MGLTSYTSRHTNSMSSVKPVSTRPQSTDVFVQPDIRYSTHVFIRRDSHRWTVESAYEGPFKVLQRKSKYYIVDKNGTNDSISINRLKAAYLEANPIHVDFPSVQSHNTTPTLRIPQPTGNTHSDTSIVSENKLKTTRSGRRVRFPKHLNDYCTSKEAREEEHWIQQAEIHGKTEEQMGGTLRATPKQTSSIEPTRHRSSAHRPSYNCHSTAIEKIRMAIRQINSEKAVAPNSIPTEALKSDTEVTANTLHILLRKI
ncbi:unnamed protein product [Schistosoma curassoni]|uniref:MBD domain-containing protein n=1 Tax=Schistosoma curassoni TaxID=6186 RepID=A0A183L3I4_9TREM|nr:unnamed protein product [Schistosoma curassoni]